MELEENRSLQRFSCPYCGCFLSPIREGKAVFLREEKKPAAAQTASSSEAEALVRQAQQQKDPKKRYKLLCQALERFPEEFSVHEALLYHGRLHEPLCGKGIDYSIIKCHLLSIFEQPGAYTSSQRKEKLDELLRGPQLVKTMALAPHPEAFFEGYLRRLAKEYLELFIQGSRSNQQVLFAFHRSQASQAQRCAESVRVMLREAGNAPDVPENVKGILCAALRESFSQLFPGHDSLLG